MALCRMLFCIPSRRHRVVKQTPKKTMFFRVPIRVPTRVPIRVPGQAQTVCLVRRRPCAFALLRRDTQRVWGLGEANYLDKIHIIALSKEAIHELINLDIILGSFLDGVSGAPDDSL